MKIVVVGAGYVGLSNAAILSISNDTYIHDISSEKLDLIDKNICPFKDIELQNFFKNNPGKIKTTRDPLKNYKNADFVVIATPTNYDPKLNYFDTSSVSQVIENVRSVNKKATIVIRSTIPIGFTKNTKDNEIIFAPEFLREGSSFEDTLNPSRIIVSNSSVNSASFAKLLVKDCLQKDCPILMTASCEAESIKLFANSFLAMRVSFFNELDTFCHIKKLKTEDVISGVCLDSRIGDFYNNPSFGYGGYCLPKDVKQLRANFEEMPQALFSAVDRSNALRKEYISKSILDFKPNVVGIYKLSMKSGADNYRSSAIIDIIEIIKKKVKVIIFEPMLDQDNYKGIEICNDLKVFKSTSDLIITNRLDDSHLNDVSYKVFTRDIFQNN